MTRRSLLIAEDDPHIRRVLEVTLRRQGFDVTAVPDGTDVLAILDERSFDLVLVDGMMLTMGGLEVCRRVKADPRTAAIPVVMLTARASAIDEDAALSAGVAGFIRKPFDAQRLGEELLRVCEGS